MRVESAAIGSPGARRTSTLQQWATVFLVKHSGGCALLRLALACIIAAFDTFELDYLSAQVGEDRSGKRACQHLAQFQHTHTVQHARHIEPLRYLFDGTPV